MISIGKQHTKERCCRQDIVKMYISMPDWMPEKLSSQKPVIFENPWKNRPGCVILFVYPDVFNRLYIGGSGSGIQ